MYTTILLFVAFLYLIAFLQIRSIRKVANEAKREVEYFEQRFQVFRLREKLVKYAIKGIITQEECINQYNSINYMARYVRDAPFFYLRGLILSIEKLGITPENKAFDELLKEAPDEMLQWYRELAETFEIGVKYFTPIPRYTRMAQSHWKFIRDFAKLKWIIWFILKSSSYRKHPFNKVKITFGGLIQQLKEAKEVVRDLEVVKESVKSLPERVDKAGNDRLVPATC